MYKSSHDGTGLERVFGDIRKLKKLRSVAEQHGVKFKPGFKVTISAAAKLEETRARKRKARAKKRLKRRKAGRSWK